MFHDTIWAGSHLGRDKTIEKVTRHFYWKNMRVFIAKYCDSCITCLAYKEPKQYAKAKLGHIECKHPWDLVCIDLVKMPTSDRGYRYI